MEPAVVCSLSNLQEETVLLFHGPGFLPLRMLARRQEIGRSFEGLYLVTERCVFSFGMGVCVALSKALTVRVWKGTPGCVAGWPGRVS